jgi:tellurite methyltransferase
MKEEKKYDKIYAGEGFYWGKKPSAICDRVIAIMKADLKRGLTLLDIGCGEGRNAVYFARHGFNVTGLDYSLPGLRKAEEYAREAHVDLRTIHADIRSSGIDEHYDVLFSTGTLHYLPEGVKAERFAHYKDMTEARGLNVFTVFVEKPFIAQAPDHEEHTYPYRSGELMGYYWDWEIMFSREEIFDCMSGGIPHKHAVNRIIARKCEKKGI